MGAKHISKGDKSVDLSPFLYKTSLLIWLKNEKTKKSTHVLDLGKYFFVKFNGIINGFLKKTNRKHALQHEFRN